jgi:pimeloyl-ACP methyl ester carboxylesterase
VYVPDLPGFGLSDKPDDVLDVGGHADVLAGWLDSLDTAPVALLGNSFGCQVAVELTRRRPDLVEALILVGSTTDPTAATMWGQLRRLALDLLFEDWRQAPILLTDIRDAGLRRILATLRHAVRDRIETILPSIRVPTLLVRGAHDRIAPWRWLSRTAALTPGARTLDIEGAAHNAVATAGLNSPRPSTHSWDRSTSRRRDRSRSVGRSRGGGPGQRIHRPGRSYTRREGVCRHG